MIPGDSSLDSRGIWIPGEYGFQGIPLGIPAGIPLSNYVLYQITVPVSKRGARGRLQVLLSLPLVTLLLALGNND